MTTHANGTGTMRVLIVEDDAGIAMGLAATLRASGYAVDVTATLALASAALRVEPFDLVLLDLGLPGEDGLTIAVLERYAETVLVSMDATLSGPMSYSAKLDAIIGFVSEAPILESGCLYVKMRATRSRFGPQTQECIAAIESHILEKYAQFFGKATRSGEWGTGITAELAADYMHEQISLAASQRAAGKNSASVRRLLELAICILR